MQVLDDFGSDLDRLRETCPTMHDAVADRLNAKFSARIDGLLSRGLESLGVEVFHHAFR